MEKLTTEELIIELMNRIEESNAFVIHRVLFIRLFNMLNKYM